MVAILCYFAFKHGNVIFICAAKEYSTNGSSSADGRLVEKVQCSQEAQGLLCPSGC